MFVGTALDVFLLWFHLEEEEKRSLFSFDWSVCCGWLVYNGLGEKQKQRKLFPSVGLIVEVVICTTRCLWYYLKGEQGGNMFFAKRSSWSSKNIPLLLKLDSGRNSSPFLISIESKRARIYCLLALGQSQFLFPFSKLLRVET